MSAGIKANNDGSAAIQVGGTDYITISSTGAVTMPGPVSIPGNLVVTGSVTSGSGSPYTIAAYAAPGSYTKPANLKLIKVTVVGGGGRGGAGNPAAGGSGGGAGGAAVRIYPAPSLPASAVPYTVGVGGTTPVTTGGTTSFGVAPLTVISATGGSVGAAQSNGGAGGAGSSGDINFTGGAGAQGSTTGQNPGSTGGNSIFGGGGQGAGPAAATYGAGGGGGTAVGQPSSPGKDGAPGVVIIEEFY